MIVPVYLNRDNVVRLEFYQDGELLNFQAVSRVVVMLNVLDVVVDSDTSPAMIDWTLGSGRLELALGDLSIEHGATSWMTIEAYDPDHPDGQVLINGSGVGDLVPVDDRLHIQAVFIDPSV